MSYKIGDKVTWTGSMAQPEGTITDGPYVNVRHAGSIATWESPAWVVAFPSDAKLLSENVLKPVPRWERAAGTYRQHVPGCQPGEAFVWPYLERMVEP
ncbi:MAG TPA: hypothetical protein DCP69_04445 [Candidatus Omnitrophica bacterium]|nr:hypothetical protein [Candidatus Omnitrophota bacterium]